MKGSRRKSQQLFPFFSWATKLNIFLDKNMVSEQSEKCGNLKNRCRLKSVFFNLAIVLAWKVTIKGRATGKAESCRSGLPGLHWGWRPAWPCQFRPLEVAWTWHGGSGTRSWLAFQTVSGSSRIRRVLRWRGTASLWICSPGRGVAGRWMGFWVFCLPCAFSGGTSGEA